MKKYQNKIPDTDYPLLIKNKIANYSKNYSEEQYLQRFQYIIQQYIINSEQRGLLVFHSTGTGKSILAASLIDYYRKYDPKRKIIALLPKSLQQNLEININKYMRNNPDNNPDEKTPEFIEKTIDKVRFISLNASNMFEQITRVNKTEEELHFEKQLTNLAMYVGYKKDFLENSIIIMDEAHNFSNSVTNGSKNAVKLYDVLMKTKDVKIVFLTATPIVNEPFELTPIFNLLRGIRYVGKNKYKLFPENQRDFYEFFINKDYSIKNKEKFQNRIFGFVSYYGDYFLHENEQKSDFPIQLPSIIEEVPMSATQYAKYQEMREIEQNEEKKQFKKRFDAQVFAIREETEKNSYRIRSRQVSNFFIPDYAIEFRKSRADAKKRPELIKANDLANLKKLSPKFQRLLQNIDKHPNQLGMVYSEFVHGEGLNLLARVLQETRGYVYWKDAPNPTQSYLQDFSQENKTSKTFAIISGDVPPAFRQTIISVFNNEKNSRGGIISLLLVSKTGAEGISLKNVRHIHILEPFWNHVRIEQVIARGVRYRSHLGLPFSERNVQPYIYISTYPSAADKTKMKESTTDEHIYNMSLINKKLRTEFELAILEASIDCSEHINHIKDESILEKIKCRLCAPTHQELYNDNLFIDIETQDVCKPIEEASPEILNVKELIINGVKYYYSSENGKIEIYEYNKDLGGYTQMQKNNPTYAEIVRQLLSL